MRKFVGVALQVIGFISGAVSGVALLIGAITTVHMDCGPWMPGDEYRACMQEPTGVSGLILLAFIVGIVLSMILFQLGRKINSAVKPQTA